MLSILSAMTGQLGAGSQRIDLANEFQGLQTARRVHGKCAQWYFSVYPMVRKKYQDNGTLEETSNQNDIL